MLRRGLRLEYATLGWNAVGTVFVLAAAVRARSVALAGFGLDSLIEIVASLVGRSAFGARVIVVYGARESVAALREARTA